MTSWLLDTNILSELRRPAPEPKVSAFVAAQPLDRLYISIITLAEFRFGIEMLSDVSGRARLEEWMERHVRPMFAERALPLTEDVMLRWRLMVEEGRRTGHTFSQPDLMIAATASCHGLTVVSRDVKDFRRAAVPVFNPWTDSIAPSAG